MSIPLYRFYDKVTGLPLGWAFALCEAHKNKTKIPDHAVMKKESYTGSTKCFDCVKESFSERGNRTKD